MDIFYKHFKLPSVDETVLAEFESLPIDPYTNGRQRYRRFSQYRMTMRREESRWILERLPHRAFVQPAAVNTLVGGVMREFEPLRIDPSPQVAAAAQEIGLDTEWDWQINVHQCRVITGPDVEGVSVPEGPHRDGHDYAMLAVFGRKNISGGESLLMPLGGGEPFFQVVLQPNEALAFDDTSMWHTATDLVSLDGGYGHRDLWIVVFNRWDRRKYGSQHETEAKE